ncbi:MAG: Cell shape-determining protein MreC [Candidatus Ordinivivax streblomastigis]|uniref:Cell shape-determining protein MreC n=1 Tax=Candidatus Ordinivivax streblomastigis TaxID=2540710 RepID=A0A5M8P2P9_9BACT|nr:MAG: Cell shape-determining protein MreC [Candidatus Ordinivivax streblomastigis]
MRNLVNFIVKNIHWLFFFILLSISVLLINQNNQFQRSKYLSAARELTGNIHSVTNELHSYLNLKTENEALTAKISKLETEVFFYQRLLDTMKDSTQTTSLVLEANSELIYRFLPAKIVNNSVSNIENYMTLNKGSDDGIQADMGVLTGRGAVAGVVVLTSPHFSEVISVLNPKFKLSCKIKKNNYIGPLVWDGKDSRYTYLTELPRHVDFAIGDTIVTSGYSAIFPAGIPVGSIVSAKKQRDDNYTSIKVKLYADLNKLNDVVIVQNSYQQEQQDLQNNTIRP